MKFNYIISGTKNNKPLELSIALDGIDQRDSFKYLPSYIGERQEFDEIDKIDFQGKY